MKLLLSNKSAAFTQNSIEKKTLLTWNTRIGQVISNYNNQVIKFWTHSENLKDYKTANITFQLATRIQDTRIIKISSNLIAPNIFNPSAEIFCINTSNHYNYVNLTFCEDKLDLNDCFIDNVIFKIEADTNSNNPLPNLEFKIGIDFIQ